ncbi:hypothetical protein OGATHE_004898, partial [Ogataea polymorpha]
YRARSGADFQGELDRPSVGAAKGRSGNEPIQFEKDKDDSKPASNDEYGLKKRKLE